MSRQPSLFGEDFRTSPRFLAGLGFVVHTGPIDPTDAPEGFIALSKNEATTSNICASCDARPLCAANEDDWCLKHRCMSDAVLVRKWGGKELRRADGQSVLYKRIEPKATT